MNITKLYCCAIDKIKNTINIRRADQSNRCFCVLNYYKTNHLLKYFLKNNDK